MKIQLSNLALMVSSILIGTASAEQVPSSETQRLSNQGEVSSLFAAADASYTNAVYQVILTSPHALHEDYANLGTNRKSVVSRLLDEQKVMIDDIKSLDGNALILSQVQRLSNSIYVQITEAAAQALSEHSRVQSVVRLNDEAVYTAADEIKPFPFLKVKDPGDNVTVALVGQGVDYTHTLMGGEGTSESYNEALDNKANAWTGFPNDVVIGGLDFASEGLGRIDYNPMETAEVEDPNGILPSGTMMASQVLKHAPDTKFYVYKTADWIPALFEPALEMTIDPNMDGDFSDRADIIVLDSWGFAGFYEEFDKGQSAPVFEINFIRNIAATGSLVITSAGDETFPSYFNQAFRALTPDALTVGTLKQEGEELTLSHFSPAGPGRGKDVSKPDVVGIGENVMGAAVGSLDEVSYVDTNAAYGAANVAGIAAKLLAERPDLSSLELKAILTNTASKAINGTTETVPTTGDSSIVVTNLPEVQYIGGGAPILEDAIKAPVAVWETNTYQPSLSYGFVEVVESATIVRELTIKNLSSEVQSYNVSYFANGSKENNPAITYRVPSVIQVPANSSVSFPVVMTIDANKLSEWPITNGQDFELENWHKSAINGYITLVNEDETMPQVQIPWIVFPKNKRAIKTVFGTEHISENTGHDADWAAQLEGDFPTIYSVQVENTSNISQSLYTMPLMASNFAKDERREGQQGNLFKHVAAGVYPQEACTSGSQLSVAVSMFDNFSLPMVKHFDRPGLTGVFNVNVYLPEMVEEYDGDPLLIDGGASKYPEYAVSSIQVTYSNTDGKFYTQYIDYGMVYDPSKPTARIKKSKLPVIAPAGGNTAVANLCLDELYHHDIDSIDDFNQLLGWQFGSDRDVESDIDDRILEFNPVLFGEHRSEFIDHTGKGGYPHFGVIDCQPQPWDPDYCLEEKKVMLGTATKMAKVPGIDPVSEAEDQTLDWRHQLTLEPGEKATVSMMSANKCDASGFSAGHKRIHPDCTPGVLIFNPESGYVHADYRNVASVQPQITQGQGFSVYEDAENGHVIGKLDVHSTAFIGTSLPGFYLVSAIDGTPFSLTPDGQILVANADAIDYEKTKSYVLAAQTRQGNDSRPVVTFEIHVSNVNDVEPVQLKSLPNISIALGESVSQEVASHFIDAEGDGLTFSATGLPQKVTLSRAGQLTGTPSSAGVYNVYVVASDGVNQVNSSFSISVEANGNEDNVSDTSSGGSLGYIMLFFIGLTTATRRYKNK